LLFTLLATAQQTASLRVELRVLPVSHVPTMAAALHQVSLGGAYLTWQPGQAPALSPAPAPRSTPIARPIALGFAPSPKQLAQHCRPLARELSAWQEELRRQNADLCTVTIVPE
jgi:hypothetical protein